MGSGSWSGCEWELSASSAHNVVAMVSVCVGSSTGTIRSSSNGKGFRNNTDGNSGGSQVGHGSAQNPEKS